MNRKRLLLLAVGLIGLCLIGAGLFHFGLIGAVFSREEKFTAPPRTVAESYGNFDQHVTILFGGDVSFGESYGAEIRKMLATRGYDFALAKFKPLMMASDFAVLNLETPMTNLKKSPFTGKKDYVHWTDPVKAPATLKQYHVRLVNLANNHTLDYGLPGLAQTFEVLHQAGIAWIGAGATEAEAQGPYLAEMSVGGAPSRIAILSAFEYSRAYDTQYHFYARGKKPGAARLSPERIVAEIKKIRQKYPDAYVIFFPHWGGNYVWRSNRQVDWAHKILDGGADLIIGTGAHRYQEIEQYNGKWIVYNLGNFMFNAPGRYEKLKSPPYGLIATLMIENRGGKPARSLKLYPMLSDNRLTDYQPRLLEEPEFADAYRQLSERAADAAEFARLAPVGQDQFGRFISLPMD
jgi:poly-gamma-glutamate capsule biosynthesis protein CapA/YwtB (metallophosphatase superfamily)